MPNPNDDPSKGLALETTVLCPFPGAPAQIVRPSAEQKTMVLTGASRGIGHATVKLFSEGGRLTSLTTPVETWMNVFHVNFLAPILLARGLFDELRDGSGTVVNVTSIVGSRVHPFAGTAYATSKAALACLTREMAHDLAPHGIRVNAIAPGEIKTQILSPETEMRLAPGIPMQRIG